MRYDVLEGDSRSLWVDVVQSTNIANKGVKSVRHRSPHRVCSSDLDSLPNIAHRNEVESPARKDLVSLLTAFSAGVASVHYTPIPNKIVHVHGDGGARIRAAKAKRNRTKNSKKKLPQ